jgi:predicted HicB family RNase H-like nuclease
LAPRLSFDTIFVIHEDRVMGRNVTFRLDEETLRKARVRAAERGISLSKLVEEMIVEELRRSAAERQARGEV